jgi:hypothetical protein
MLISRFSGSGDVDAERNETSQVGNGWAACMAKVEELDI